MYKKERDSFPDSIGAQSNREVEFECTEQIERTISWSVRFEVACDRSRDAKITWNWIF